jgi:hypothetical protein
MSPTVPPGQSAWQQRHAEIAQRQYDARYGRAEHLQSLSRQNGNQHLSGAASRMQHRADQRFEHRNAMIDGRAYPPMPGVQNAPAPPAQAPADPASQKPTWRERVRGWWPFGRS